MASVQQSRLAELLESGGARPPTRRLADLPEPGPALPLSGELATMRRDHRY